MKFTKGQSGNPKGRPPGAQGKFTVAARDAFQRAFDDSGGVESLTEWAKENRGEFYRLFARLIPTEVSAAVTHNPLTDLLAAIDGADTGIGPSISRRKITDASHAALLSNHKLAGE